MLPKNPKVYLNNLIKERGLTKTQFFGVKKYREYVNVRVEAIMVLRDYYKIGFPGIARLLKRNSHVGIFVHYNKKKL